MVINVFLLVFPCITFTFLQKKVFIYNILAWALALKPCVWIHIYTPKHLMLNALV